MKTTIATLLATVLCATAAWAQTSVSTDDELRSAITDGANITVTADIDLSNSTLSIAEGTTVTIDLGGYTLDRKLRYRGEGGGQVITVRKNATLNISNGTLKGGWGGASGGISNEGGTVNLTNVTITGCTGDDRGGGICNSGTLTMTGGSLTGNTSNDYTTPKGGGGLFNAEDATATLKGVTIKSNKADVYGGGGICNYGTLTIDGCTITGNTAGTEGGGVWNSATATLNVQGETAIMANTAYSGMTNNVFLETDAVVTVTGTLAGSQIGISMKSPGVFTSGFSTKSGVAGPTHVFSADLPVDIMAVSSEGGEGKLSSILPTGTVYYVDRDWDGKKSKVTSTINYLTEQIDFDATPTKETQYKLLTSSSASQIKLGTKDCDYMEFYVVSGKVTVNELYIVGPYVHIVLCDESELVLGNNITVRKGHHISIHDQGSHERMGKLYGSSEACIGGKENSETNAFEGGEIWIYGGDINVKGHAYEAGIGGDYKDMTGDIFIYGGKIRAEGGEGAAGIGSGSEDADYGTIHIYGGIIDAIGGINYNFYAGGAGIGGGADGQFGRLYIYGGYITATTKSESAGIGSSQFADFSNGAGIMFFYGGTIKAYGGDHAAGIGGGDGISGGEVYIYGGHIEAYGGNDAAGIGGGEGGNGARSGIYGGYVYAKGGWEYGAGIGGGQGGGAEGLEIHGGIVIAEAGMDETGCRAIGPGSGCDDYGDLWLDPKVMVTSERTFTAGERTNGCRYRTRVRVEPCTHPDHTYTVSGNTISDTHLEHCVYCNTTFKEGKHDFSGGTTCSVCGVTESTAIYTVKLFQPVENGTSYDKSPVEHSMIDGTKFKLPAAPDVNIPINLEFAGWLKATSPDEEPFDYIVMSDPETLLDPGTEYEVRKNVKFYARYKEIDITLKDNVSNGETLSRYDGKQVNVTLSGRTLYRDGRWNTLCLPFNVDDFSGTPLAGATVKTLQETSFDNGKLTITFNYGSIDNIMAGHPYIVKWETTGSNITDPAFTGVTISNSLHSLTATIQGAPGNAKFTFTGAFSPVHIDGENKQMLYLGPESKLYYPDQAMNINACRSYFQLKGISAGDITNASLFFDEDENTTAIKEHESHELHELSGAWFTLSGMRLNAKPTAKGVYIFKGKKQVIQ